MKLAIMQPYIFPYIGYFQLINSVDTFVFYDDVNFIKQGWINRNKVAVNDKECVFSVPIKNCSSFCTINKTEIDSVNVASWKNKFCKTIAQSYSKSPFFKVGMQIVEKIATKQYSTIDEMAKASIATVCDYLNINTAIVMSSAKYLNTNLKAQDRIIDICNQEKATTYINAIGGQELYDYATFEKNGLKLSFIKSQSIEYNQGGKLFLPNLSIIDVLMWNSKVQIAEFLKNYELIPGGKN